MRRVSIVRVKYGFVRRQGDINPTLTFFVRRKNTAYSRIEKKNIGKGYKIEKISDARGKK